METFESGCQSGNIRNKASKNVCFPHVNTGRRKCAQRVSPLLRHHHAVCFLIWCTPSMLLHRFWMHAIGVNAAKTMQCKNDWSAFYQKRRHVNATSNSHCLDTSDLDTSVYQMHLCIGKIPCALGKYLVCLVFIVVGYFR